MVQGGPGHRREAGEEVQRPQEEVGDQGGRDNRPAGDQGKGRTSAAGPAYYASLLLLCIKLAHLQ